MSESEPMTLDEAARLIERMPARCRRIFMRQVIDGASYTEIAAEMGIPIATVRKRLARAFEICAGYRKGE